MKKGKRIFALITTILLVIASFDGTAFAKSEANVIQMDGVLSYKVIVPEGYDNENGQLYPVLYLMPEDGEAQYNDKMVSMIQSEMTTDKAGNMIVVMPSFDRTEDFRVTMDKVIADVDRNFKTIPTVEKRAVLGVGIGGYMAYILGMTDEEKILTKPDTIKNIASIRGHFVGSENTLYNEYGDVYNVISQIGKSNIVNYYTYLDGPTEDTSTSMSHSTNDIGALFINWYKTISYDLHEYTSRYGVYDDSYLQESISRVMNRFSQRFYSSMVNGDVSLSPQVAASSVDTIEVGYDIDVSEHFSEISPQSTDMLIEVKLTDPVTGDELYKDNKKLAVDSSTDVSGSFSVPNTVNGTSSSISVTAKMLGYTIEIGNQSLVRIMDTGTRPDEQLIDLMGDWKFSAYKPYLTKEKVALDDIKNVTKEEWNSWGTVQPALGWWTATFESSLGGNPNWTGYAWYVREFDMPTDFKSEDLLLALGKFDEANEVYVNGVRVGATGIPEAGGNYDESNPWDVDRLYELDSTILNYGGSNTIAIRMANSNGGGGWYQGPVGIYSPAAYNKIVGLPSELADSSITAQMKEFVEKQNAAIEAKDIDAYAKTVASDYFQSGYDKERLLEKVKTYTNGDGEVTVTDQSINVYIYKDMYLYQAERTILTAKGDTITEVVNHYYTIDQGNIHMYGDHDRFYVDRYTSSYAAAAKGIEGSTEMNYRVYLPEGYFESDKRYPVTYLLHQFSSTSKSYEIDGIDRLLDKGIANGDIKDMIVVIPDSDAVSWWRDNWELMVTEDLVPFINEHYRTVSDARYNGTAGASMGGQGAYGIGLRNPNYFSSIISFFGAFSYGREYSPNAIAKEVSDEYLQNYTHYFISGNRDIYGFGTPAIQLDQQLREKEVEHMFLIENGEHDNKFYLPHVIEAFSYVSKNMYSTSGDIANNATGTMEASINEGELTISSLLHLTDFDQWMNSIPASTYTKNPNPEMIIPVTYKIEQGGKTVFSKVEYPSVSGSTSLEMEKNIILEGSATDQEDEVALDVDLEKEFTLTVFATLLDTNKELGTFKYTPETEEEVDPTPTPAPTPEDPSHDDEVTPPSKNQEDDDLDGGKDSDGKIDNDEKENEKVKEENTSIEGNKNGKLPNTATNTSNILLIGIFSVLVGLGVLGWRRFRMIKG
ncbi:alpha/beta hydrolase-fold protein [Bacillus weihaiensis]|uniref:Gram-positive cocci surface proteins LPxTG domain-containing protein n=1 Tax=Bacillus weihaiensis TaxID=1547283 RepID=A0A1L3MV56_9BACI|nr:alpha/beta hydrolase-fold protein [Bacillus weihaiensis]APH06209.1 hypothetical protein A9C19_16475 [Bacillus weihaiensis]